MPRTFTCGQSAQNNKICHHPRRTALSLLISGLLCSVAPAWADCVVSGTPNANGGVNMICEGVGISQDTNLLGNGQNNNVIVQGADTSMLVGYGGYSIGSDVTGNTVTFNDSSNADTVYGGSGSSAVTSNAVILNDSSSVSIIYGGSGSGAIANNAVILNDNSSVGTIYGGSGSDTVMNNSVTLNNYSSVDYNVFGGSGTGVVAGNSVTLNDSGSVSADVFGGYSSGAGTVTGNTVTLNDSSRVVRSYVYGGYTSGSGAVTGNIVTLYNSSRVDGSVFGGYSRGVVNSDIIVTGNTVNISDSASVSDSLYGGFSVADTSSTISYDVFTNNTLNFAASPVTLGGTIANFENYNFTLDPAFVNTDTALITADNITFGTNDTNMKGSDANTSKIQVVGIKSGDELFMDDTFVLMRATDTMSGNAEGLTTKGIAQQGISLLYDVETVVDIDGKRVTATILGNNKPVDPADPSLPPVDPGKPAAKVNPQLKALSEGHLASAMMLTRGADTLAYNTVHAIQHQNPEKGLAPFITLSGDKTRYNSGSHINARDGLLTGGLSWQTDKLTSAVIIESGWGSYDTHNDFNNVKDVNGDGHNRYAGAALLGHYNFDSGVFAEASFRAGKNRNTFNTKDIVNLSTGEYARYNLDSNYLGAHIGAGYSKALDEKNTADVSAKYLWTQLKGKDVKIAGDTFHFDDINSHRMRLDAGVSHQYTEAVAVRAGFGYEYEFDGKANSTTYGYDIAAPGVKGGTGILTLGSTVKPLAAQPLSVDVNLDGYTGKRDGVGGSVKFSYAF